MTDAIRLSGRADLKVEGCGVVSWDEWRAGNVDLLRGVEVGLLVRRLGWRGSVWPWRRRAALSACRELIRIRERELGLD